ncbi:hypothetical protein [Candidatus Vidania fulgoroideorum]
MIFVKKQKKETFENFFKRYKKLLKKSKIIEELKKRKHLRK